MITKNMHKNFLTFSMVSFLTVACSGSWAEAKGQEQHKTIEAKAAVTTNVPVKVEEKPQTRMVNPTLQRGEVVSQVIADVDGDGAMEKVMLMGSPIVEKSSYMGNLYIVSMDPHTNKIKGFVRPKDLGGYNAYLSLADVTGSGSPEVLVTAPSGGTAGIVDYRIIDFSGKEPREIFTKDNNRGVSMVGSFLPDFKARLYFPGISKEVIVDLADEKEQYEHLSVYNKDGSLKASGVEPFVQDISSLVTLDINDDGIDDVITTQKVFGGTNVNGLGYVRTVWEYRAGTWQQRKVAFQTNLYAKRTYNVSLPVKGRSGYEVIRQEAQLDNNTVAYPRFTKLTGAQQWKINSQLENFAKNVLEEVRQGGQVELSYEVKYAGENYSSVLFKGTVVKDNQSTPVLEAYNFDMITGADMSLNKMTRPFNGFWKQVKTMLSKENISFDKEDIYGYYYDGSVLGLLYGEGKEFDVEGKTYGQYLSRNILNEKIVTDQSIEENPSKKEKKSEK